jgi:hypothetical protein
MKHALIIKRGKNNKKQSVKRFTFVVVSDEEIEKRRCKAYNYC